MKKTNKKYRLKKNRAVSILIIMGFLISFLYIGMKDNSPNINYEISYNYGQDYFICKDCNILYFETEFVPRIGYIFPYEINSDFENIVKILNKNNYILSEYKEDNSQKSKFAQRLSNVSKKEFEEIYIKTEADKILKNTIIILVNEDRIAIKLPNLNENKFINHKITTQDLEAFIEEILALNHKTPIKEQTGISFLDVIAINTEYNRSVAQTIEK
jgi:hypothetical protein